MANLETLPILLKELKLTAFHLNPMGETSRQPPAVWPQWHR